MKHLKANVFIFIMLFMLSPLGHTEVFLKDIQGHQIAFNSLKGQWVLINYWAGWCKTCIAEIPEFNRFYQKYAKKQVRVFGVNYDALPIVEQQRLTQSLNIQYPMLISDPASELGLSDIAGVPVTFVFNPQGELTDTLYGGQSLKDLERATVAK